MMIDISRNHTEDPSLSGPKVDHIYHIVLTVIDKDV